MSDIKLNNLQKLAKYTKQKYGKDYFCVDKKLKDLFPADSTDFTDPEIKFASLSSRGNYLYGNDMCHPVDQYLPEYEVYEVLGVTRPEFTIGKTVFKTSKHKGKPYAIYFGDYVVYMGEDNYSLLGWDQIVADDPDEGFSLDDDIIEVYSVGNLLDKYSWEVVWKPVDKKQLNIQKALQFAEAKLERLQSHINVLKGKL